ncbi:MAG TPA: transglycosylase family protein [Acidimicrobiales bacterium]|nr:transglycosylase family protein [Acidimicrobiales bacterium]
MIVGIAIHQTQSSQAAAGSSAADLGSRLAADSLAGANSGSSPASTTVEGPMGGLDIALTSLHVPVAAAPAVAVAPAPTNPAPPTTTSTTTSPTTTTTTSAPPAAPYVSTGGQFAELRECESGNNYSDNTGNGYYGAYQFSLQTWQGIGYSGLPSDASPSLQDQAAQQLQAQSGWGQWPACSAELGLR